MTDPSHDVPPIEDLHISMAVDHGFELPLGVAVLSLAESCEAAHRHATVTIVINGVDEQTRRAIEHDVAGRLTLEWIEVDPKRLGGASYTVGLSSAALFRLLLPELLGDRTRTIYLDADTLVLGDLADLWATPLANRELVAAVRDGPAPYAAGPAGTRWRELGFDPANDNFNSGVMVIPLDRWRQEGTGEAALAALRSTTMTWGDQDALNLVTMGRWHEVSRRWNLQTADAEDRTLSWVLWRDDVEAALADPAVIHYTEPNKPWTGNVTHPFADRWFATMNRSSWATWSPRTPVQKALGRLQRAARVLRHG